MVYFQGRTVKFPGGTWRIIPVSKWLITMVIVYKSPKDRGCGTPSKWPNFIAYKWGVILTTYDTWDDPPSIFTKDSHQPSCLRRRFVWRLCRCLVGVGMWDSMWGVVTGTSNFGNPVSKDIKNKLLVPTKAMASNNL